ncbi:MAG: type VI secretion system tube protein Hcp [Pirellulaceae bacterium]|nr:type VI secretion system tube protein Hcp [Pirellulaceae bacterium]
MAGYLKIGDIKGESTDAKHKEWIDLESMSQGLSRPTGGTNTSRNKGSVQCGDVVCTKRLDASTPKLIQAVCDGTNFKEVLIDVCSSQGAGGRVPFFQWKLKNVRVSNYNLNGSANDSDLYETLSLNYEAIDWIYDKMGKDGKSQGKVDATWKVEEGEK